MKLCVDVVYEVDTADLSKKEKKQLIAVLSAAHRVPVPMVFTKSSMVLTPTDISFWGELNEHGGL